ncbi:MAG: ChaB family protein [Patescibacteria group bacterium]
MPYNKDNPPDRIKGLPAHAQDIWINAYNSAHKDYPDDEERCNKIAWGAVKNAGYVEKDGKWVKEKLESPPRKEEIIEDKKPEKILLKKTGKTSYGEIKEGKDSFFVEANENIFKVQIINVEESEGWSLNGNFWTDKALTSLAEKMNNKRCMATGFHFEGTIDDEIGLHKECQKVAGKKIVESKLKILGDTEKAKHIKALINEQIKTPSANLLGFSVVVRGPSYEGEVRGKKGIIVEDVHKAYSTDIVFDASAGGSPQSVMENLKRRRVMEITLQELQKENPEIIEQVTKPLNEKITLLEKEVGDLKKEKELQETEKKKLTSETLAKKLLAEAKFTDDQAKGLLESMVGKEEAEMTKLIEERKEFIRKIAPDVKFESKPSDPDHFKDKPSNLKPDQKQFFEEIVPLNKEELELIETNFEKVKTFRKEK